jgi:uncharacterized phage protein gp47/JayE
MADLTPTIDFKKIVENAGIPTTEEGWIALFRQDVDAAGSIIENDSSYSSFWRLVSLLIAKPATFIVNKLLIDKILPNMFLQTATDDEFIETKAWEHDLTRKQNQRAKGNITFYRAASLGPSLLISAGTVVQTDEINGITYRVKTTTDVIMQEGELSVLAPVIAENAGEDYNLGAGYFHILPESVTGIGRVNNDADWLTELGADAETNEELKSRTRNAFTAAAPWHIDAVYTAILTEKSGLNTNNIFFEHSAPRGPGTANAYILLDAGEPSAQLIADLNEHVNAKGYHGHGDDLQIFALPGTDHAISVTVYPKNNLLTEEVNALLENIENFIRSAFRENNNYAATKTAPNSRFSFSRLGQELHREFSGIESLNWGQNDITSDNNVPRLTGVTVTNGNA